MNHRTDISRSMRAHTLLAEAMLSDTKLTENIERAALLMAECLRGDGTVLVFGNGGSASDAQHIAGELVGRFAMERRGLRAIALTTDSSVLTSLINDYGYDAVFARQVEALGRPGDIALAISTSGNSPNILRAIDTAKTQGMRVIGLSGGNGGKMGPLCDILLLAPSVETPRIQEGHTLIYHILCGIVEREIFGKSE